MPQCLERKVIEQTFVRGLEHEGRRHTGLMRLYPTGRAHAPLIAGLESRKTELGPRRTEIIADALLKIEKLCRQMNTSGVFPRIFLIGLAASVPEKSGQGVPGAGSQGGSEHILL
jgi:hypothetical protein